MAKRKPRRTGTGADQQSAKPPRTPAKQPPYVALLGKYGAQATTAMTTASPHRRQGDRGGGSHDDNDSDMRVLPVYVRFSDLRAARIAHQKLLCIEGSLPSACAESAKLRAHSLREFAGNLVHRGFFLG